MNESNFGADFGANPGGCLIKLNSGEIAILDKQAPETKTDGGWQNLMVSLQQMLNRETGDLFLPTHILTRIRKYAFEYGNGGNAAQAAKRQGVRRFIGFDIDAEYLAVAAKNADVELRAVSYLS